MRGRHALRNQQHNWVDWNVPEEDGKVLYDLITDNSYTRALEIGTSTGHSTIWIASALSETGGRLITVEIDKRRYRTALINFEKAELSMFIDARLADAHKLLAELEGPFDFIFCDADKDGYTSYFIAAAPKLEKGGCFTAHNVLWHWNRDIQNFLRYVRSQSNFITTINKASHEGISVSYKSAVK